MSSVDLPAAMQQRFTSLKQQLHQLTAGKRVYYHPNPGNWGDGLIMAGTQRFLADAGIEYTECHYRRLRTPLFLRKPAWLRSVKRKNSVLLFGGGGGMCQLWDFSAYVSYIGGHFEHTIMLPSTFELKPTLRSATLFCRDRFASQALTGGPFCDDMAFYLGRQHSSAEPSRGIGNFFRTDRESAGKLAIPADNRDLSIERDYHYPVGEFFAALSPYATIHTDRLHVAIASCLLGKAVKLYPGSYFKSEAVFRSSMEGLFPKAEFFRPE